MRAKKDVIMSVQTDGRVSKVVPLSMANDDPIRAGRLAEKARQGNKSAAKRLEQMKTSPMVELLEPEDEEIDI